MSNFSPSEFLEHWQNLLCEGEYVQALNLVRTLGKKENHHKKPRICHILYHESDQLSPNLRRIARLYREGTYEAPATYEHKCVEVEHFLAGFTMLARGQTACKIE